MAKILSLDLGTASIGYAIRNTDFENGIIKQLINYGTIIFQKGVGNGKTGEFSYAAERTKHRSSRRLYQSRRYRIWKTLEVLIEYGFCPLLIEDLDKWRKHDKRKGLKRQYPVDAAKFEQWIRLDFDGDSKPDYSSPYQLRTELATIQLDFSLEVNKYKLGRALYHIAQRRGFKSSKGETLKEQEETTKENIDSTLELDIASLKKSEEKKSKDLVTLMSENSLKTVGCAFAKLENDKIRIRASSYQAVRSQYKEEIKYIFEFQKGLDVNSEFFKKIYSDRKDGSIFYKRPLRSQKGLVGKCTLEPTKSRCPISHPEFEKFRAFAFINNIQYRKTTDDEWQNLSIEQKLRLFEEKFLLTKPNFKFEEIRKWLEKEIGNQLSKKQKITDSTVNYSDKANVSGCPISGRLKNLLGSNWDTIIYKEVKRKSKTEKTHIVTYLLYEILWHVCFSFDDEEAVNEFAKTKLKFDNKQTKSLVNLWVAIPQGYSMLSLKAIKNINRFLVPKRENKLYKGFIYTEAALLGKMPEILSEDLWGENEKEILESISYWINENRAEKRILNVVNNLISNYKSLEYEEQFAYKNTEYQLDKLDKKEIEKYTQESFGENSWKKETQENKDKILEQIANKYQYFFSTSKRDYFRLPKIGDTLKLYLSNNFLSLYCENNFINPQNKDLPCECEACKKLDKLYHPSAIEFYKPVKEQQLEYKGSLLSLKLLQSPIIGAFKNPMAMRTLHILRKLVNYLIKEGLIDGETRIVVETARDLNDANMRWAIEKYQRERELENKEIAKAIKELRGEEQNDDDIDKARLLIEQNPNYLFDKARFEAENVDDGDKKKKKIEGKLKDFQYKKDITKYKLWLEQGMQCIYTGKIINVYNLFDENVTDFEHTIPRSQSFDNSLANQTICDSYYNRHIKKNRIPTQLENYNENAVINGQSYSAIKPRLEKWEKKVMQLKDNVEFWKQKSKQAQTKDYKDSAIRQKNVWQMELNYWQDKLSRFTMTEVTSGFKHSQLNDTRLITKYAYHYLKSVFNKVEVQKGSVTADFRKMLGVQSVDEKKRRDKHSHHAIDAVILSLIPVAAKRDKMLELFYKIQEEEKLNQSTNDLKQALKKEIKSCQIGNVINLAQHIDENILIKHIYKDQTLTPAKRKARKRGKIIGIKDETGKYLLDKDGRKIPKYWIKGDSIRGELHQQTYYGKIKRATKDKHGSIIRNSEGEIIYNQIDGKDEIWMVIRKPIEDVNFNSDVIIDEHLANHLKMQISQGIKQGELVDLQGNRLRRIRCRVKSGRGFMNPDNVTIVKEQIYKSDKDYKNYIYADSGDNYMFGLYENEKGRQIVSINKFEASEFISRVTPEFIKEDLFKTKEPVYIRKEEAKLVHIFEIGQKVIFYENLEELLDIQNDPIELSKRLYFVKRLHQPSVGNILFQHHLEARSDDELLRDFPKETFKLAGRDGFSSYTNDFLQPRLLFKPIRNNFIIEGKDFEMSLDGTIKFF